MWRKSNYQQSNRIEITLDLAPGAGVNNSRMNKHWEVAS